MSLPAGNDAILHEEMVVPLASAREWWDAKIGSGGWHPDGLDSSQA